MAFIRSIVFLTFDENDTYNEKKFLREDFESRGFKIISETTLNPSNIVKEWIMSGPVQLGTFKSNKHENVSDLEKFKP